MNLMQAFKVAVKSIISKKGRSVLTMLGVIIGVAAVIVLVSYAEGQNRQMREYFESLGENVINIEASVWNGRDISTTLYNYCMEMDDLLVGVTPKLEMWNKAVIKYGAKTLDNQNYENWFDRPQIIMGNHQYSLCNNYTVSKGRDLSYLDVQKYSQVCVLGAKMASLLFNYADPIGKTITINGIPFEVIGVFEEKDPNNMNGADGIILVSYTMNRVINNSNQMSTFVAKARDAKSTTKAVTLLTGFLQGVVGQNGYSYVSTPNQQQEEGEKMDKKQQLGAIGIAAISLTVGGIGIMNIMLVTVTERTREIGIRKAIGAERKSIIAQFLIEACVICGIGGVFGIICGSVVTLVVGKLFLQMLLLPSVGITIGAFLISVALGVGFGLFPAIKASSLQPVVALRAD